MPIHRYQFRFFFPIFFHILLDKISATSSTSHQPLLWWIDGMLLENIKNGFTFNPLAHWCSIQHIILWVQHRFILMNHLTVAGCWILLVTLSQRYRRTAVIQSAFNNQPKYHFIVSHHQHAAHERSNMKESEEM